ncbi:MAG: ATP-binding protein [Atopobium sp.]|uniref:ATP-binding protein n=1 Tax=Atopobium sp. TaxID=1872650 RepID=UPI002A822916|nr:ATP-binding protein [Atopobium sp.]MDY4523086.1 ATP-binding protein [Atopobium sp.]
MSCTLSDLFARHGGVMPKGGFSIDEIYEMNTMTDAEFRAELQAQEDAHKHSLNEKAGAEQEAKRTAFLEKCHRSGMPKRFDCAAIDTRRAQLIETTNKGFWICGNVGAGKTHLACSIFKGWLYSGKNALFVQTTAMLANLRDAMSSKDEVQATALYAKAPLLVLDDLGKEAPTPWALAKIFEIVDTRYSECLPTIVTGQHMPESLAARFASTGDKELAKAVVSRLSGTCTLIKAGGDDRRFNG